MSATGTGFVALTTNCCEDDVVVRCFKHIFRVFRGNVYAQVKINIIWKLDAPEFTYDFTMSFKYVNFKSYLNSYIMKCSKSIHDHEII